MGVNVKFSDGLVEVLGGDLQGVAIDARDIPDLVPACAVLGCFSNGTTEIYNAGRLRIKESDRLGALPSELRKMGARIVEKADGLTINGPCDLRGVTIDSHDDHRIAMACAVAALRAKGKTEILRGECVSKSYPSFFDDLKMLGGMVYVS
jgi:3-phosphoshikimate 1-carboxyvinyltransferase